MALTDDQRALANRLLPGAPLLDDHRSWAPAVPHDLAKPPPIVSDGHAACESCAQSFPLAALNITAHGYRCEACAAAALARPLPENVKVGRGRWWLLPAIMAPGVVITILYPVAVFVLVLLVAAVAFRLFLRRGL
jgi:hypothetical protein